MDIYFFVRDCLNEHPSVVNTVIIKSCCIDEKISSTCSVLHCYTLCVSYCRQTMQFVILTYMKHLGVKVKEHRGLEHKRIRITFLPRIKVQPPDTHTHSNLYIIMQSLYNSTNE